MTTTSNQSIDGQFLTPGYEPTVDGGAPTPPTGGYLPPLPQPEPRRRGTAAIAVGAVIIATGLLTAASGGALLGLFGGGNAVSSGDHPFSTSTTALVTDLGHIDGLNGFDIVTGSPTLHINAESIGENGVFVGVGPTDEVDRYLDGASTETVTDLDLSPFHIDTVRSDGASTVEPPAAQNFWVASSESTNEAELTWKLEDGRYEIVVMNADGTAGVLTSGSIGASLPNSTPIWLFVLSLGILIMIGGGVLLYSGIRQGPQPTS